MSLNMSFPIYRVKPYQSKKQCCWSALFLIIDDWIYTSWVIQKICPKINPISSPIADQIRTSNVRKPAFVWISLENPLFNFIMGPFSFNNRVTTSQNFVSMVCVTFWKVIFLLSAGRGLQYSAIICGNDSHSLFYGLSIRRGSLTRENKQIAAFTLLWYLWWPLCQWRKLPVDLTTNLFNSFLIHVSP